MTGFEILFCKWMTYTVLLRRLKKSAYWHCCLLAHEQRTALKFTQRVCRRLRLRLLASVCPHNCCYSLNIVLSTLRQLGLITYLRINIPMQLASTSSTGLSVCCRPVKSHSGARRSIFAGPLWGENFWIFFQKTVHSGVLYILSDGGAPQTSRGPG